MKHSKTVLIFLLLLVGRAWAQTPAIEYTVALADPARHLVHVTMRVTPAADLRVQLPVWNALYQVRDFSQFVLSVRARDGEGRHVPVRTLDKTTWAAPNAQEVEYELVANTSGPFGAQFNGEHAFFNLAEVLMYVVGQKGSAVSVRFANVPADWKIATSLPNTDGVYTARNYDQMVDSPVEIGKFALAHIEQKEGPRPAEYWLVIDANREDYDAGVITQMVQKIVTAEVDWMQDQPFEQYWFIYHFPRRFAGGGMEHAYSTAIDAPADRVKKDPMSLAGVTAHEFFHLWNVKRIRPQSLEPVDYTREQYTRALWFSEGVTSAVTETMRVRAGLLDEKRYLHELAGAIRNLESRPARLTQSVEESSLTTWFDKYPFYEQPERSISYYNKGEIVGVLLDLAVREASGGKKSLRDVFHWMNEHWAKQGKFFPDTAGVEEAAEAVSGADLKQFFADYVAGVQPLPYDHYVAQVGLRVDRRTVTVANVGFLLSRPNQGAVITNVDPGSEAEKAGLRPGDILQTLNGEPEGFAMFNLLERLKPGDTVRLRVARGAAARELTFKVGSRQQEDFAFVDLPEVTAAQRARRAAWIRGDSE